MLIDTHAHLDFKDFDLDCDEVIKRAFENGIEKIINVGCSLETSRNSIKLSEKYENIFASVGIHPNDEEKKIEKIGINKTIKKLKKLAENSKVVAIGEIGLDYFRIKNEKDFQKEIFLRQIELAQELNLPVIIHCRDAYKDILEILKKAYSVCGASKPRGVCHCFLGDRKIAKEFFDLGFLISFTGAITYQKLNKDKTEPEIFKVIKEASLEKIMLDSDSPFLAPVPNRGKRNEPSFIKYTAQKISEIKNIEFKKIAEATTKNAKKIFPPLRKGD